MLNIFFQNSSQLKIGIIPILKNLSKNILLVRKKYSYQDYLIILLYTRFKPISSVIKHYISNRYLFSSIKSCYRIYKNHCNIGNKILV